jgi:hypothetical protein
MVILLFSQIHISTLCENSDLSPSAAQLCCDSPLDIELALSPALPAPSGQGFFLRKLTDAHEALCLLRSTHHS